MMLSTFVQFSDFNILIEKPVTQRQRYTCLFSYRYLGFNTGGWRYQAYNS